MLTLIPTWRHGLIALAALAVVFLPTSLAQQPTKPYKVTIVEDNARIDENVLPIDPAVRIAYTADGGIGRRVGGRQGMGMGFGVTAEGKRLAECVGTLFMIDGVVYSPTSNQKLQKLADVSPNKKRHGGLTVWQQGDIRVTMILEVVPGKPSQTKPGMPIPRRMDTLLVKYIIENTGSVPHKVGCRPAFHSQVANNVGALFAAPGAKGNDILDGVILGRKGVPDFLENLERPNVDDPGFKAIWTLKLENKMEPPEKVVLTRLGLISREWDVTAELAGNSALALFWQPKEIRPRGKREVAFGYGQGIACVNEGRFTADFGGSFDPGKRFTITAYIDNPPDGQSLNLQLPKGIERIDGKATQLVPQPAEETGKSVVMWRCRLLETGAHPISIRSSTGETKTWSVSVTPAE